MQLEDEGELALHPSFKLDLVNNIKDAANLVLSHKKYKKEFLKVFLFSFYLYPRQIRVLCPTSSPPSARPRRPRRGTRSSRPRSESTL